MIQNTTQIQWATHPAQLPKEEGETRPNDAAREKLLSALAPEEDEDEENAS